MTITREQVQDLQPGDVVQVAHPKRADTFTQGPITADSHGCLMVGNNLLRSSEEWASVVRPELITVVSRAPRPLYVNHPRTEPVLGDVVRDGNGQVRHALPPKSTKTGDGTYSENEPRWWASIPEYDGEWLHCSTDYMRRPLTLLIDGETGQAVP